MRKSRTKKRSIRDAKDKLKKRVEEGYNRRGSYRRGVFIDALPEGVTFWKCGEGEHIIDIIPYWAGPNDPLTDEGDPTYVLELKVHQNVGPTEGVDFVCLAENFNKPCPICEHRKQLRSDGADDEIWKALYPKRRAMYNILCYDTAEEEDKNVQIWEVAWWFSERFFVELAKGSSRSRGRGASKDLGFINFSDPDEGKSIAFSRQGSGSRNTQFLAHRFLDRDYSIPDDILNAAWTLDELIYVPSYDEVYEAYWGEGSIQQDQLSEEDTEAEEEAIENEQPERPSRVRGRRLSKENTEPEEEDSEEESSIADDEQQEDSDGEEEELPECFAVDTDELDDCESCKVWDDCVKAYEKREKEKEKKRLSRRGRRRGRV